MLTSMIIFNIVFALINLGFFYYNVKKGASGFYAHWSFWCFIINASVAALLMIEQ